MRKLTPGKVQLVVVLSTCSHPRVDVSNRHSSVETPESVTQVMIRTHTTAHRDRHCKTLGPAVAAGQGFQSVDYYVITEKQPQVPTDGGHDLFRRIVVISDDFRTVGTSHPYSCGRGEPPYPCRWDTSYETCTYHNTQSLEVERDTLSTSTNQQQQGRASLITILSTRSHTRVDVQKRHSSSDTNSPSDPCPL